MADRSARAGDTSPTGFVSVELDAAGLALERVVVRVEQAIAVVGVVVALAVAALVSPVMGAVLGPWPFVAAVWFTGARALLDRGRALGVIRWAAPLAELVFPGVALVTLQRSEGAAYALGSWVPPMLFMLLILLSVLRLRPALPAVVGVLGAGEYLGVYALALAPELHGETSALLQPRMQVVRATSLVLFGLVGMVAAAGLRSLVGSTVRLTRAKDLFGKYRLGAQIAAGGMGTVYEALYCPEGGFQRRVAIKRVHPHLAADPSFVESFRREAELGAMLAHPNIVAALDFGRVEDTFFFAMEHVDGMDLLRVRKRCAAAGLALPTRLVAYVSREIAEGLAFAHEAALDAAGRPLRVVHRDLNPANVLVSTTGQVKISDFGVARTMGDQRQLETRHVVGKMAYLAPEQARGEAFDVRADLHALGLLVWELLCLRPVFRRPTEAETLLAVLECAAPLPSAVRPELAGGPWDRFCAKAISPDPASRFQTARDMASALSAIMESEGVARPEELAAFLAELRARTPAATSSGELSVDPSSRTEAATVKESV